MSTTTSPSRREPEAASETHDASETTAAGLSLPRLHLLRFGYLVMAVGLTIVKWPLVIQHEGPWPVFEGALTIMLVALSFLSFLGLRYPVQMLPILLFESLWKLIWLAVVALPMGAAGQMDSGTMKMFESVLWVVIVLAVIPWRFVFQQYVLKPGDRWRMNSRRPAAITRR